MPTNVMGNNIEMLQASVACARFPVGNDAYVLVESVHFNKFLSFSESAY